MPLAKVPFARPFIKWAGGKGQLLPEFEALYPRKVGRYLEPFLGGGAVFFHAQWRLHPAQSILADNNEELIATFRAVKENIDELVELLRHHKAKHSQDYFYEMRKRTPSGPVERAARLIYLNKTCFNGLYRVNSRNEFNVPFGRYSNPNILDVEALHKAHAQLRHAELHVAHFSAVVDWADAGDFVYFDPPYQPVSDTAKFTSYTRDDFDEDAQKELARVFAKLHDKGCRLMLSNSDTPLIHELYRRRAFKIRTVLARRSINSKGDRRGKVNEVVVLNYDPGRG